MARSSAAAAAQAQAASQAMAAAQAALKVRMEQLQDRVLHTQRQGIPILPFAAYFSTSVEYK